MTIRGQESRLQQWSSGGDAVSISSARSPARRQEGTRSRDRRMTEDATWLDEGTSQDADGQIDEYDLTSSPNDFNIKTIYDFIDSGAVKIPGFQRNYVWDIKRASKLIESLIIGLPVPQVFLYEEGRNSFLVIDGQQRLMTIYYFVRQRFPRREKRAELRRIFNEHGRVPDETLHDDELFENFNLRLPEFAPGHPNKFARLNYSTLGDYKLQFDLRTIRNVIVKQIRPSDDDSSIYEMFNRLNTGGINLTPQEIRASLYHSSFYDMLFRVNLDHRWRELLGQPEPDLHMRDIEVLLRGVAMWQKGDEYAPSMVRFLNMYSKEAQAFQQDQAREVEQTLNWFLAATENVPRTPFLTPQGRFSVPLFESVFAAASQLRDGRADWTLETSTIESIKSNEEFLTFSQEQTTNTSNVKGRLRVAKGFLTADAKR